MKNDTSHRGYILTINNPDKTKEQWLDDFKENYPKTLKYIVLALEKATSGTLHIQGYVEFKSPLLFSGLKSFIPKAHIEPRHGTPKQAADYVKHAGKHKDKEGDLVEPAIEYGEMPVGRGKRTDLDEIAEKLEQGASPREIRKAFPALYLRLRNHIRTLYQEIQEERYKSTVRDVDVFFIYGDSRTGKTSGVYRYFDFDDTYRVTNYQHPYDGYEGQDILVLEEFHGQLMMSELLQLLEGYPMKLRARYYDRQASFTKVCIITNKQFENLYPNLFKEEKRIEQALRNRITKMIHVKQLGDVETALENYYESPF